MKQLYYIKDIVNIDRVIPEMSGYTFIIYSDIYEINTSHDKMKWSEYKNQYLNLNIDNVVVVGMNRIRSDKDRLHNAFGFLYTYSKFANKLIIDDKPFNHEPWRLWYHFGFVQSKWLNASNSFPIQLKYEKWYNRDVDDCEISAENLKKYTYLVHSDLPQLVTVFNLYQPDLMLQAYYNDIKAFAFEKYDTPGLIIQFMLKTINKHLSVNVGYESYLTNQTYNLPNVGLYRFVIEENKRRMDIYNTLINV